MGVGGQRPGSIVIQKRADGSGFFFLVLFTFRVMDKKATIVFLLTKVNP